MTHRLVGWILLLAVLVSSTPWEIAVAQTVDRSSVHAEAAESDPCCDPIPAEAPCDDGDGCLCPCCPAQPVVPEAPTEPLRVPTQATFAALEGHCSTLHPSDFIDRLFHPPRIG